MIRKLLFTILIISFFACDKDEASNAEKSLVGTWDITSISAFGIVIPGDGYFTFNECGDSECTGVDYEGAVGTSGVFTYELSDDESVLTIVDNLGEGGANGGVWSVDVFSDSVLTISQASLVGSMIIDLKKR